MLAVRSADLKRALSRIQPCVVGKGALPILANVLLEARAGRLWMTATDLDVMVSVHLPLIGGDDYALAVTVNCQALIALVRHSKTYTRLWGEGDALLVAPSDNAVAKLATLPADEFPSPLSNEALEVLGHFPSAALRAVYQSIVPFSASGRTWSILRSVRMRLSAAEAEFVAADGFKLAILRGEYEGQECEELCVPAKGFAFMRHFQGQVSLSYKEEKSKQAARMYKFEDSSGAALFVLCHTGGFPELHKVIPHELTTRFMVSAAVWEQGLRTIMSPRKKPADESFTHSLKGNTLTVASQDADRLAACRIPVEMLEGDAQGRMVFAGEHLLPLLGCVSCGYVEVAFRRSVEDKRQGITSPFVFESPGWMALLMPMASHSFLEEEEEYGREVQALAARLDTLVPVEGEGNDV